MEQKINIAELLKDCPKGMELDCVMFENVTLSHISENSMFPIKVSTPIGKISLSEYGCYTSNELSKCIIFPKGKTTWEGFHRPFKDGDIIYVCDEYSDGTLTYVAILKQIEKGGKINSHCFYNYEDDYFSTHDFLYDGYNTRFATEEEKEKLFQVIKDNGFKWNSETKTLERIEKEYPKTYAECCKIMQVARPTIWFDYDDVSSISKEGDEYESHIENTLCTFRKLLICRDAYWNIYGKQMGLGKPWEPDYKNPDIDLYVIINIYNRVEKAKYGYGFQHCVFTFPTPEMRDAFYENFKTEIEECKELL